LLRPLKCVQSLFYVRHFKSTQVAGTKVAERIRDSGIQLASTNFDDRLCEKITQISRGLWRCEVSEISWTEHRSPTPPFAAKFCGPAWLGMHGAVRLVCQRGRSAALTISLLVFALHR
jgi:hypothetical protein